jgi:hypothetical protein
MTGPTTPGVTTTARVLVGAATATLPSGELRERYRREHLGELSALPTKNQIHYAAGDLLGVTASTTEGDGHDHNPHPALEATAVQAQRAPPLAQGVQPGGRVLPAVSALRQGRPRRPTQGHAQTPPALRHVTHMHAREPFGVTATPFPMRHAAQ